jgi:hypothetical protein
MSASVVLDEQSSGMDVTWLGRRLDVMSFAELIWGRG